VQAQSGIPYLLIDGSFENTPAALRLLADVTRRENSAARLWRRRPKRHSHRSNKVLAAVPADKRPRVYLARGPAGLESGSHGSINTEIIERVGGVNVVQGVRDKGGLVDVSPEQVITLGA